MPTVAPAASSRLPATLGFGLGLVVVLGAADLAITHTSPDVERPKHLALYAGQVPAHQLLLGTSHVFHGVDPRLLEPPGTAIYNLGVGSANPTYLRMLYRDVCRYAGVPRTIYFGLDPLLLKRFPWSHHYGQDSGYWPWGLFWENLAGGVDDRATIALNRCALVRQRDAVQDALAGVRPRVAFVQARAYHGFVPLAPDPHPAPEGTHFPDDPGFAADLPALFESFRADGVRVVCFQTPEYLPSTGDHHADNEKLAAIAGRFGFPFLNYNGDRRSAINQNPALFNDGGHLNLRGSDRFTPLLRHDLQALGAL